MENKDRPRSVSACVRERVCVSERERDKEGETPSACLHPNVYLLYVFIENVFYYKLT